ACDAYVSLHRSEGLGLTISAAMALGETVIATGWSGNMDFMNAGNSYPVRYELVELADNVGPYRAGDLWAEPSVEHAAELMRRVFENPAEAAARGNAARREIAACFSEEAVAGIIAQRLEAIALSRRLPEFRRETRARYRHYRQGIGPIREVVRRTVPAGSTVLVVSKGDDALLEVEDRKAWHFPRGEDGRYAGYYPADSAAAVAHLEALRGEGAGFLLFPASAFWWLEHYRDFGRHLETCSRVVHRDDHCLLFVLHGGA
ncbi:MAG TPA: hypothetical protein VLX28_22960, partial [Thermoanaerobaculia bacterium]|nr:hypothetical protein [Thermoanaerobaculia bacterium]